jgi:ribonuclease D
MFQQLNDTPELPLLAAPRVEAHFVDQLEALRSAVELLKRGTGPLAVDAERASGFKYSQRAYLVQVHREGSPIFLIDPIAFSSDELQLLAEFMNDQEWILHAATQDLACLAELGLHPKTLFDTELISRLLGFERVGLGAVCELALGVRLAKEHSAADWSTRPLPESWLVYAALDVDVLPEMRKYLLAEVERQQKQEFVLQEMRHLLGFKPKGQKLDKWRSMTGIHDLREQRQLAIAKSLWEAREALAQRLDVSPGRLIPDSSVVHAAKSLRRSKSELAGDKSFNGRASRSYLDTWWSAIEAGQNTRELPPMRAASIGIPNHRNWANKFPDAAARYAQAREAIAKLSEELKIPVENILSPDPLRQLCFEPNGFDKEAIALHLGQLGARAWQVELVAKPIALAWESEKQGQTQAV